MKKSLRKFIASCEAGEVSEGAIRGMRRTISARAYLRPAPTDFLAADVDAVLEAIERHQPRVSAEQMEKGRAWLLKGSLKLDGSERKNPIISGWRIDVTREACCARLVSMENLGNEYRDDYFPIYRYETADGRYFDYAPRSWQSGRDRFESFGGNREATATPEQWRARSNKLPLKAGGPVLLRLTPDGDVETSNGYTVSADFARTALRYVGSPLTYEAPAVGIWPTRLNPDGSLTVGCTTIDFAELANIARLLAEHAAAA